MCKLGVFELEEKIMTSPKKKDILKIIALTVIIGLGVFLGQKVANDESAQLFLQNLGFFGVFIVAYGSGFNLIVPIPAATFVPAFTSAGFEFWTVVTVMAFGLTAADLTAFLIGRAGRGVKEVPTTGWAAKIERYQKTHPRGRWMILFFYASFFPLPNEVLLLPMGYLGARLRDVFLPVLLGNFIFNAVASHGIVAITNLFR